MPGKLFDPNSSSLTEKAASSFKQGFYQPNKAGAFDPTVLGRLDPSRYDFEADPFPKSSSGLSNFLKNSSNTSITRPNIFNSNVPPTSNSP